jgi:uncharacterized protein involved in exopolysaccharide biosynthesis
MNTETNAETPKNAPQPQTIVINSDQLFGKHANADDEIDLRELWNVIWQGKWIIFTCTALFAIVAVIVALYLPNIYKSSATLIPTTSDEQNGAGALASRFGGLASMAGISLGGSGVDKTKIAIETLKSREFLSEFIKRHELKTQLLAVKTWNAENNTLIYNDDVYNANTKVWTWKTQSQWKKDPLPTDQEAVEKLLKNITVNLNEKSSLVTISAMHFSPFIAQQWVQWLIDDINQYMRQQDISDAKKSIEYLSNKLEETSVAEMQKIFYELIEQQTKTKMLAEIRDQYVLKIIDPPTVPEKKDNPKRAIICLVATLLGGMFGVTLVFVVRFIKGSI